MEKHIRPRLSHSNSFGNDAEKDTAGCRALNRKSIVIGVWEPDWLNDSFGRSVIEAIDKVPLGENVERSLLEAGMRVEDLCTGTKNLLLCKHLSMMNRMTMMGENCYPFLLDAAEEKEITMGVTAYFLMRDEALKGRTVHFANDDSYVSNQMDFLYKITQLIGDGLIDSTGVSSQDVCSFEYESCGYIAQKDIAVAVDNIAAHPSVAGVYAQQAVEKMLKQYLTEVLNSCDENLLKTHNLRVLSKAVRIGGLDIMTLWDLSDAYKSITHPNSEYCELSAEDARKLCEGASATVALIEKEITNFRGGALL